MIKLIYSKGYFYSIIASIVLFLSLMSFGLNQPAIVVYFINFFLASSYSCIFIFKKLKEEYFYASVILCAALAIGLYVFYVFFEKYSFNYKIYLLPIFVILNLTASLYFLFRKKLFNK